MFFLLCQWKLSPLQLLTLSVLFWRRTPAVCVLPSLSVAWQRRRRQWKWLLPLRLTNEAAAVYRALIFVVRGSGFANENYFCRPNKQISFLLFSNSIRRSLMCCVCANATCTRLAECVGHEQYVFVHIYYTSYNLLSIIWMNVLLFFCLLDKIASVRWHFGPWNSLTLSSLLPGTSFDDLTAA